VHGSITSQDWGGFDELLAKNYQVFVLNLPGFGASDTVSKQVHNTALFAQTLTAFTHTLKKLQKATIITLSLGSLVALKAAEDKNFDHRLILVGMPTIVVGGSLKLFSLVPLAIKRLLISTCLGRKNLVLPLLKQNTFSRTDNNKNLNSILFNLMASTDTKAIADPDYYQDIKTLPQNLNKIKNKVTLVYGERDTLRQKKAQYVNSPIIIPKLGHNIFSQDAKKSFAYIAKYLP